MTRGGAADALQAYEQLIQECGTLDWDDLSLASQDRAAWIVADTVGAIMAGAKCAEVSKLAEGVQVREADGAEVLVPGLPRASPSQAAFVNAIAAVSLELDEGGDGGHAAAHVVPAALAAAQQVGASGADLLLAVVACYEVAARLGATVAWNPPVHGHGHVGTVGAAVSVALLRGHDPFRLC